MPKINQILHFHIFSSTEEEIEEKFEYKTRIADELEHDLCIELPIHEGTGRYRRMSLGDELSVVYVTEDGVKHFFHTHVTGYMEDSIKLIRIYKPDPQLISKTQRRHFLRVPATLEVAILTPLGDRFNAVTDDVGGGGVSFIADGNVPLRNNDQLDCWILIPFRNGSIEHASFKAEIVRLNKLDTGRVNVMVKFSDINDFERQKVIRYCFERQLDFRNR